MGERVELFIAGVQKGGTTALFQYMREWPSLVAPAYKELHFFDNDAVDWRSPDHQALHDAFPPDDGRMRFEATPMYFYWPPALPRIHAYNPRAKLIVIFRDPAERALSQWKMMRWKGTETRSFSRAIREPTPEKPRLGYVERGLYADQVERALALFDRDQLLFLRSGDLAGDPDTALAAVARFAGLPAPPTTTARTAFTGPEGAMSEEDRTYMADLFADDQRRFSSLTGLYL